MSAPRPPRLPLRLIARWLPPDEGEALAGDLLEAFAREAPAHPAAARRRVWREALVALLAFASVRARRPRHAPSPRRETRMATFLADLRLGARLLRRAPGFTAACVITLAFAIGATAAIFSVTRPLLLGDAPYPDPGRLTFVYERGDGGEANLGFETVADLVRGSRTIERAAAVGSWAPTLAGEGPAERLIGERVSWTFLRTLGVAPALGRDFTVDEDAPGRTGEVILTHGLWARRFGGDPAVVGRAIALDGRPMTVVGVLPASFENVIGPDVQLFRVLGYDATLPYACRTCRHLRMVARLRPGVTRQAAAAELDGLMTRIAAAHPADYPAAGVVLMPLLARMTRDVRAPLLAVLGAVGLVLLIALANVTSLQLARALRREEEFAIRTALGAGRARLAQQLLGEGLVLAAAGGALGVALARLALPVLVARLPEGLPRTGAIAIDAAALALVGAIVLGVALVVGLVPAWRGERHMLFGALRSGLRLVRRGNRLARAGFVVGEVALALVLCTGAGLLARSLVRLLSVDAGFDATPLLTLDVQAAGAAARDNAAVFAYQDRVLAAVRAIPGVRAAALASQLPLSGNVDGYGVQAKDRPLANPELAPSGDRYAVSVNFHAAMRIPLLHGRPFAAADDADSAAKVAIVSAALARRIWGTEDAVGREVQVGGPTTPWRTVVGVVGDVRHGGLDAQVTQQLYLPERQWLYADDAFSLVVRAAGDPAALAPAVRRAIAAVDPTQPLATVATMDALIARSTAQRQLALQLFAAFGLSALLLAAAGIYGVLAGDVAERTREIGLRSALGASPRDILALVVRQGAALTALGVALGVAGAMATARLLRALLFGVTPADPLTFAGVVLLLAAVALVASVLPALRALRVDPMTALRSE